VLGDNTVQLCLEFAEDTRRIDTRKVPVNVLVDNFDDREQFRQRQFCFHCGDLLAHCSDSGQETIQSAYGAWAAALNPSLTKTRLTVEIALRGERMKVNVSVIFSIVIVLMAVPVVQAQHAISRNAVVNPAVQPAMPIPPPVIQPFVQSPIQPFIQSPVQPFMQSPIQPFGVAPIRTAPLVTAPIFTVPTVLPPGRSSHFGRRFNQGINDPSGFGRGNDNVIVFAPGGRVVGPDSSSETAGTVFTPGAAIVGAPPGVHVVRPDRSRPEVQLPAAGTPRDQVLQQFGTPAASVITREGETLVFNGGVTIFLQNDQVASPK
jgi:hypothetical protein